jgi:hypothetical protein
LPGEEEKSATIHAADYSRVQKATQPGSKTASVRGLETEKSPARRLGVEK